MKTTIKSHLQGIVLALVLMLGAAVPVLQATTAYAADGSCENHASIEDGLACTGDSSLSKKGLFDGGIFTTVVNTFLFIIGAVSVIMIIYGGFKYVTSGGDSSGVTSAKNTILYAVIGLIVAMLAYAIMNFVVSKF